MELVEGEFCGVECFCLVAGDEVVCDFVGDGPVNMYVPVDELVAVGADGCVKQNWLWLGWFFVGGHCFCSFLVFCLCLEGDR